MGDSVNDIYFPPWESLLRANLGEIEEVVAQNLVGLVVT